MEVYSWFCIIDEVLYYLKVGYNKLMMVIVNLGATTGNSEEM